ncbi:hypothetical protein PGT21_033751 [Puccinia graminis f. sp. tritici]|uniref:Uncharacterized protein n=2 Tax=Puccinia graminis f. sp. tritici TaxID=56615 RepID=E3K662_PUCGT|nr:uncharacterized protein PGTG_05954 [Puccinia graminis f. sp. tritici CRL 75-36-700-3]EFP79633.1 hypothetical protein PGTG_05954 [Puccinia graminis f. sp. tritici CRL 75-36-700-3]KAA1109638.1 hypothetical protein PGTUg99_028752 [Puccinia graminis f. sp. tritici]KAA1119772.1 hypothetical protein PGT21_033751 [Puccinia graminis f. sp. tritici]
MRTAMSSRAKKGTKHPSSQEHEDSCKSVAVDPSDPAKSHPQTHHSSSTTNTGKSTTTVRHRLTKKKVNGVWKPLSSKSCDLLQESLSRAMKKTRLDYPSIRRVESLTKKLTNKIRVPLGVYTGLKTNDAGKVELLTLEGLMKKNHELELLIQQRQRAIAKLEQKLDR